MKGDDTDRRHPRSGALLPKSFCSGVLFRGKNDRKRGETAWTHLSSGPLEGPPTGQVERRENLHPKGGKGGTLSGGQIVETANVVLLTPVILRTRPLTSATECVSECPTHLRLVELWVFRRLLVMSSLVSSRDLPVVGTPVVPYSNVSVRSWTLNAV